MTNDLINTGNTNIEKGSESQSPTTQNSLRKKYVLKKRQPTVTEYKVDYEKELNERQLQAVMTKEGSILVIAGAGSGKTKTLTYRVARLIEDGVAPENILLLTFTKKASAEMLNRATAVLDDRCENVDRKSTRLNSSHA